MLISIISSFHFSPKKALTPSCHSKQLILYFFSSIVLTDFHLDLVSCKQYLSVELFPNTSPIFLDLPLHFTRVLTSTLQSIKFTNLLSSEDYDDILTRSSSNTSPFHSDQAVFISIRRFNFMNTNVAELDSQILFLASAQFVDGDRSFLSR